MTDIVHTREHPDRPTDDGAPHRLRTCRRATAPKATRSGSACRTTPADYGPVTDFATDFDHGSAEYNAKAPEVWKDLREGGCPVAHSDRYGGMWVPLTHDTVHDVAYDTDNFTSRAVVVISTTRPGDLALPAPIGGAPPITSDPPFHNIARRLLLPPFAPKQIEPWEHEIRALCQQAARRDGRDRPRRDRHRRRRPVRPAHPGERDRPHARLPGRGRGPVPRVRARRARAHHRGARHPRGRASDLDNYILAQVQDHSDNPRDDLTGYLLEVEIDGQQARAEHRRRLDHPAAHRRHRHDVVGDRFVAVAPRPAPRGPSAPRSTTPR